MKMSDIATGLQHIGIPTNDISATIAWYERLGFRLAHRNRNGSEEVAFLQLGDLMVETYQNFSAPGVSGAINHIAVNVTDVEAAKEIALALGLEIVEEGRLGFWENGVQYFTVLGPNMERVEFNQYL